MQYRKSSQGTRISTRDLAQGWLERHRALVSRAEVVMIRGWLQGFIGIAITLVILVACFAFFAVRLATRSHPVPYSESQVSVHDTVRVFRNSFGIPHIIGRSID